jgi:integrase
MQGQISVAINSTDRRDYRQCSSFLEPIFDTPVTKIDTPLLSSIHDRASERIGWRRANMVRTFVSEVFHHCVPRGLIERNFITAVIPKARPKGLARANRPWTPDECGIVMKLAPPNIKGVIAVMMYTGIDPSDALALKKADVAGGFIWGERGKTQTDLAVPASDELIGVLYKLPPHGAETLLANTRGQTWTYNGFSTVRDLFKKPLQEQAWLGQDSLSRDSVIVWPLNCAPTA